MAGKEIKWEGNLDDDCHTRVGEYTAHCECLGDVRVTTIGDGPRERWTQGQWYASVHRWHGKDAVEVFHSGNPGGSFTTGALAREVCEVILRALDTKPASKTRGQSGR